VALDAAGIQASSGSACAAGHDEPSPILLALGLSPEVAQTALRFSFHQALSPAIEEKILAVLDAELHKY